MPQIGAVLVPINYRLTADDFAYIINHSGAQRRVRRTPTIWRPSTASARNFRQRQALRRARRTPTRLTGRWLDYEQLLATACGRRSTGPTIDERDLLTINYTSGTTSRPKGVMITHRNAYMNVVGTLIHLPMTPADRYLWTLPMFHANGWTFTWTVTAVGGTHVCLPKVDADARVRADRARARSRCSAPRRRC